MLRMSNRYPMTKLLITLDSRKLSNCSVSPTLTNGTGKVFQDDLCFSHSFDRWTKQKDLKYGRETGRNRVLKFRQKKEHRMYWSGLFCVLFLPRALICQTVVTNRWVYYSKKIVFCFNWWKHVSSTAAAEDQFFSGFIGLLSSHHNDHNSNKKKKEMKERTDQDERIDREQLKGGLLNVKK